MSDKLNIQSLMGDHLGVFKPIAYFDKHLDCIRVKIEDCRVVEVRLNRILTVLESRHADGAKRNVGFTIKGIAHLFAELGLPSEGIYKVVDILNKVLEKYPDHAARLVHEQFRGSVSDIEVRVDRKAA